MPWRGAVLCSAREAHRDILGSAVAGVILEVTWVPSLFVNDMLWTELLAEPQETSPREPEGKDSWWASGISANWSL